MSARKKKSATSLKTVNQRRTTASVPAKPKAAPDSTGKAAGLTPARAAEIIQSPEANSAAITAIFQAGWAEEDLPPDYKVGMLDLHGELEKQVNQVAKGDLSRAESMLLCQAHALQSMFLHFALRGKSNTHVGQLQMIMNLALKAQNQCRATLETLIEVKYPRQTSFVKQQNVAVNQQVNNGTPAPAIAPARGETIESTNGLLGAAKHERLEFEAARAPGSVNSGMATVEAINGTAHSRGEEQGETKLRKARPSVSRVA